MYAFDCTYAIIRMHLDSIPDTARYHLDLTQINELEIKILRRIFGPKRYENGEWRRLYNEEIHSLYRSPNIVRVIKSRRLRWAGHVARMEDGRNAF